MASLALPGLAAPASGGAPPASVACWRDPAAAIGPGDAEARELRGDARRPSLPDRPRRAAAAGPACRDPAGVEDESDLIVQSPRLAHPGRPRGPRSAPLRACPRYPYEVTAYSAILSGEKLSRPGRPPEYASPDELLQSLLRESRALVEVRAAELEGVVRGAAKEYAAGFSDLASRQDEADLRLSRLAGEVADSQRDLRRMRASWEREAENSEKTPPTAALPLPLVRVEEGGHTGVRSALEVRLAALEKQLPRLTMELREGLAALEAENAEKTPAAAALHLPRMRVEAGGHTGGLSALEVRLAALEEQLPRLTVGLQARFAALEARTSGVVAAPAAQDTARGELLQLESRLAALEDQTPRELAMIQDGLESLEAGCHSALADSDAARVQLRSGLELQLVQLADEIEEARGGSTARRGDGLAESVAQLEEQLPALARLQESAERRAEVQEEGSAARAEQARQCLVDLSVRLERCLGEAQAARSHARESCDALARRLGTELDGRLRAAAAEQEVHQARLEGMIGRLQAEIAAPQAQLRSMETGLLDQAQVLRALERDLGSVGQQLTFQEGRLASAREESLAARAEDCEAREQMRRLLADHGRHADALADELRAELAATIGALRRDVELGAEQLAGRVAGAERSAVALTGAVERLQCASTRHAGSAEPSPGTGAEAASQGAAVLALARCCGFVPEGEPPGHGETADHWTGRGGSAPPACAVREWELQHGERLSERIAQTWGERRALHGARTLVALALQRAPAPPPAPAQWAPAQD